MRRFDIKLEGVPEALRAGLQEIVEERPRRFGAARGSKTLRFEQDPALRGGFTVAKGKEFLVRYDRKIDAFRALGRLLGEGPEERQDFAETPRFDMAGAMIDVSRNGVARPDALRAILRRCALMGLNLVMLYAEDTYEVPGEPFFGYLRGRYTHQEMKELDDYADALGIEMCPCIQTLAHLAQILQWPAYSEYRDTNDVLIADEEKTYALIEKMIAAASAPFRSKRIHIGMDEAHGIGSGRYKELHGEKPPFDILNDHLARVRDICARRGLKPMIWSDMYFRLGSKSHEYCDPTCVVPPEVIARIPKGVQLVYWDYYHTDKEFYAEWIDRHRALGSEPVMAGGVWTWSRFWTALPFTFKATDACMDACREKGLREAFMTIWGDGGMECDLFSALPGLQYFAEHAYAGVIDPVRLRANFRGSCDADFDDWVRASDLDAVPCQKELQGTPKNISNWLLWQDPLLAIMDPHIEGSGLRIHYGKLAADLAAASRKGPSAARLRFPAQLAAALELKVCLRRDMAAACAAGDRARLRRFVTEDLPLLRKRVLSLWKSHREMWMNTYKPFGWEVIDRRYGGLLARLETVSERLKDFLGGKIEAIPELEAKLERFLDLPEGEIPGAHFSRVTTPSVIK